MGNRDDAIHPKLFIDSKHGDQIPKFVTNIITDATAKAAKEGKVPVVCLHPKGDPFIYMVVSTRNFYAVCEAFLEARGLYIAAVCNATNIDESSPTEITAATQTRRKGVPNAQAKSPLPNSRGRKELRRPS